MGLKHRIESELRMSGWPALAHGTDRRLRALHDAVIKLAREVDNLNDDIERLKRNRAA